MIYLDTSAFLTTVLGEPQSAALDAYLAAADTPGLISSALLSVEARRSVLRNDPMRLPRTELGLLRVEQVEVSGTVLEAASRLPDPMLSRPGPLPIGPTWSFKVKWDGFRAIVSTTNGLRVRRRRCKASRRR